MDQVTSSPLLSKEEFLSSRCQSINHSSTVKVPPNKRPFLVGDSQNDPLGEFSQMPDTLDPQDPFDLSSEDEERFLRAPLFTNTQVSELRDDNDEDFDAVPSSASQSISSTSFQYRPKDMTNVTHTEYGTDGYVRLRLPDLEGSVDIQKAVTLLKDAKKIVVIAGAGISVSAGIPDFRSHQNGLYARIEKLLENGQIESSEPFELFEGGALCTKEQLAAFYRLDEPESLFDMEFFMHDPVPFFVFLWATRFGAPEKQCFTPTPTHKILASLPNLHLLFTQNIDTLEFTAGLPAEKVCYCHGAFDRVSCIRCGHEEPLAAFWEKMQIFSLAKGFEDMRHAVPQCDHCQDSEDDDELDRPPILKPRIVFFGESLPAQFFAHISSTLLEADLLVVTGSSMKVLPVASIPDLIPAHIPQIVINREAITDHNFDFELLGDADVVWPWMAREAGLVCLDAAKQATVRSIQPNRFLFI